MGRTLLLALFALLIHYEGIAEALNMSLTQALKKKYVQINAVSTGGAQGECLNLSIKNNTSLFINIKIDHALIFRPSDTNYQDLVAAGGNLLALQSKTTKSIQLQTFCGKSYARGPKPNLKYNFYKQGDETMIGVAKLIVEKKLYNSIGQHAIWSLTNNHSLSGIYSARDTGNSKELVKYIAGRTGRPLPQYYTTHNVNTGTTTGAVFNPTIEKYVVVVEWSKPSSRNMHVLVHKENGELFLEEKNEQISKRGHKVTVELDPKKVAKGKYTVILRDDDNTVYQKNEVYVQ